MAAAELAAKAAGAAGIEAAPSVFSKLFGGLAGAGNVLFGIVMALQLADYFGINPLSRKEPSPTEGNPNQQGQQRMGQPTAEDIMQMFQQQRSPVMDPRQMAGMLMPQMGMGRSPMDMMGPLSGLNPFTRRLG
jgi:hypothetical protein